MRPVKIVFVAFAFLATVFILYYSLQRSPQLNQYQLLLTYQSKAMSSGPKVILLWNDFFGDANWSLGASVVDNHCPEHKCVITSRKEYLEYEHMYDAIVFHTAQAFPIIYPVPQMRHPEQTYVFALMESPAETKHVLSDEGTFYNLTMTYRLDSDVIWPYARVIDLETGYVVAPSLKPMWRQPPVVFGDDELREVVRNKKKLAAWFASHCNTYSLRETLVDSLKKFVAVDVYGKCGNLSCPRDSSHCDEMLSTDYKFYLAFENALCIDYVTEKFFRALRHKIVPVVFGGANYTRFAPPHSFIDASEFESTKQLAEYLVHLDTHPEEYMRYFWWRQHYELGFRSPFCELCAQLHAPNAKERVRSYSNIEEWWMGNTCTRSARIKIL